VSWCEIGLSNFGGVLVCLQRLIGRLLSLVANRELSKVTVVVTLPVEGVSVVMVLFRGEKRTSCGRKPWTPRSWQME
jgi:hypothetical protein